MWMWMWKGRKEGKKAGAYIPPFIRALQMFFRNKRYGHKVVLSHGPFFICSLASFACLTWASA